MKTLTLTREGMDFVLRAPLETMVPGGTVTVGDIRRITKIVDAIEARDGDVIEFEDADFAYLKGRFDGFSTWNPGDDMRSIIIDTADALEVADKE